MQKIIAGIVLAGIVIIGLVWWFSGSSMIPKTVSSNEQVKIIAEEIISIETEMSALAASTETGTFTPTAAESTKASIDTKLNTIEEAYTVIDSVDILAEEQAALVISADTMKLLLTRYQNTLVAIDTTAGGEDDIMTFESITKKFIETTDGLSEQTSNSVRTYDYEDSVVNATTQSYLEKLKTAKSEAENALQAQTIGSSSSTTVEATTTLEVAI